MLMDLIQYRLQHYLDSHPQLPEAQIWSFVTDLALVCYDKKTCVGGRTKDHRSRILSLLRL